MPTPSLFLILREEFPIRCGGGARRRTTREGGGEDARWGVVRSTVHELFRGCLATWRGRTGDVVRRVCVCVCAYVAWTTRVRPSHCLIFLVPINRGARRRGQGAEEWGRGAEEGAGLTIANPKSQSLTEMVSEIFSVGFGGGFSVSRLRDARRRHTRAHDERRHTAAERITPPSPHRARRATRPDPSRRSRENLARTRRRRRRATAAPPKSVRAIRGGGRARGGSAGVCTPRLAHMFSGFMSPCITPSPWRYLNASRSCRDT